MDLHQSASAAAGLYGRILNDHKTAEYQAVLSVPVRRADPLDLLLDKYCRRRRVRRVPEYHGDEDLFPERSTADLLCYQCFCKYAADLSGRIPCSHFIRTRVEPGRAFISAHNHDRRVFPGTGHYHDHLGAHGLFP